MPYFAASARKRPRVDRYNVRKGLERPANGRCESEIVFRYERRHSIVKIVEHAQLPIEIAGYLKFPISISIYSIVSGICETGIHPNIRAQSRASKLVNGKTDSYEHFAEILNRSFCISGIICPCIVESAVNGDPASFASSHERLEFCSAPISCGTFRCLRMTKSWS